MAGEKEVKAQVRLRFWNVKRERMVATRNLQVTVKKGGGLTMKTLEGILSKVDGVDTGDKVSLPFVEVSNSSLTASINHREMQSRQSVLRWMQRCLVSWVFRPLFWTMLSFAIKRNQIGLSRSHQRSRRSLTIFSKLRSRHLQRFDWFLYLRCSFPL